MDDEKAEVLMEVTDFIFEDLIENLITEMGENKKWIKMNKYSQIFERFGKYFFVMQKE